MLRPIGSFQYSHAVGKTSSDKSDAGNAKEIQEDAVFLLASQTKLLTAFAAMLVVERGLVGLDDDVAGLLPELGGQKVLVGFEDDGKGGERAILEERKGAITLRYADDPLHYRQVGLNTLSEGCY
jgi:CubicO group peptidase (beta-lactamase class C family)